MKSPGLIISVEFKMCNLQVKMIPKQFTAKITEPNKILIDAFLQKHKGTSPKPDL